MVFCYKTVTDPKQNRSGYATPRKKKNEPLPNIISDYLDSIDSDNEKETLPPYFSMIPDSDWRLLAALARKRENDAQREAVAVQVKQLWETERVIREYMKAEKDERFRRFIHQRQEEHRRSAEDRRLQRNLEEQVKRDFVVGSILYRERKNADHKAENEDRKLSQIIDKAFEDRNRATLVADRRFDHTTAKQMRARTNYVNTKIKTDLATKRRTAMLKDASRRIAINSALNEWDTTVARHDMTTMEAQRRALQEAHIARMDARSDWIIKNKERRKQNARLIAEITAALRTAIKQSRPVSAKN